MLSEDSLSAPTSSLRAKNRHNGKCTRDPKMNLIIQYGLLGLVLGSGLGLGLGLGFILYCCIWRPWHYRTCAHSPGRTLFQFQTKLGNGKRMDEGKWPPTMYPFRMSRVSLPKRVHLEQKLPFGERTLDRMQKIY